MNKCCLCGEEIEGFGNNAEPLSKGRCCDECNANVVTFRIYITPDNLRKAHPNYSDKKIEKLYDQLRINARFKCLMKEKL